MPPNKRNVEGCCTAGTFWKLKLRASMASAAAKTPTRSEVLSLFRCLLRTGRDFCDYNVREYTKRRTIDAFRSNRSLSDQQSVSAAYADGKEQLAIAKRQAIVYSLYSPKVKSIMELNQV
ncbi:hypothetical protein SAY86_006685 [Trapa natans]|nr:hypothetical protein SAY86_006685 [Trapa natans]